MKKDFCTLYLIRHGETEWNRDRIIMGHTDTPLTEIGVRQADELSVLLKPIYFSAVYSSDSPRAVRTAEAVIKYRSLSIQKSAQLRERHFSRFEGMPADIFREQNKADFAAKEALPESEQWKYQVAGCVESDESLVTRVITELREVASAHRGETVLVSTHGGPIRHMLIKLGFAPYGSLPSGSFKNAGYVIAESDGQVITVKEVHGIKEHENNRK
ncbi:MAG: histidine phosphatase family protein [bacterium]|nr:histidine phosphatase family protein [bacterium]